MDILIDESSIDVDLLPRKPDEPLLAPLPLVVWKITGLVKGLGMDCQSIPEIREEVTIRVYNPNGQWSELLEKLREVTGFKDMIPVS